MPFAHVGPDLAEPDECDFATVLRLARREEASSLADALLDQRIAARIGNMHRSKIMFMHRLHPATRLRALSDAIVRSLFQTARTLLLQNIKMPRHITTYNPAHPPCGTLPPRLFVYGRAGEPRLRCATPIVRSMFGRQRRSTYTCPVCQPAP